MEGCKGGKYWDNCNSKINKIHLKKDICANEKKTMTIETSKTEKQREKRQKIEQNIKEL